MSPFKSLFFKVPQTHTFVDPVLTFSLPTHALIVRLENDQSNYSVKHGHVKLTPFDLTRKQTVAHRVREHLLASFERELRQFKTPNSSPNLIWTPDQKNCRLFKLGLTWHLFSIDGRKKFIVTEF